ncbi:MAG TPA: ABC transporter substrate-binding protein [Sphingomicrobium sp.]|nr:ABC transporter substrate-binding protein [Sphingomicrobium sp.]
MRHLLALLLIPGLALVPAGCRPQPQGAIKAVVIGEGEPKVRDPALGPLKPQNAVLLQNVAQGLVRFDAGGNIVAGLAERWNVSDDGLSYIFRLAGAEWPDGKKITAEQVARILKRQLASRSRNELKDALGAVQDIVAMTDRVIEIQLVAPRPNLLSLLAQPELAVLRGSSGSGPFTAQPADTAGELRLTRELPRGDDDEASLREEVLLATSHGGDAVRAFANGKADLVLGGTFADLAVAQRTKLPRAALRFDPASGLFGLVPARIGGALDKPEVRRLLAQILDRGNFVGALGVPGLAARATLLEPGLTDTPAPVAPTWSSTPLAQRLPALRADSERLLGKDKPVIRVALPDGPGGDLLLRELARDWGMIGLTVERAAGKNADFILVDEVAPSTSAAWFVRRFRCGAVAICDPQADELMDAARQTPIPAQRYALLSQAAARIDDVQLFIPITAPVRWSLVSSRIQGFAGNRYASHTLTGLEQQANRN